jgi:hypothetical protein
LQTVPTPSRDRDEPISRFSDWYLADTIRIKVLPVKNGMAGLCIAVAPKVSIVRKEIAHLFRVSSVDYLN